MATGSRVPAALLRPRLDAGRADPARDRRRRGAGRARGPARGRRTANASASASGRRRLHERRAPAADGPSTCRPSTPAVAQRGRRDADRRLVAAELGERRRTAGTPSGPPAARPPRRADRPASPVAAAPSTSWSGTRVWTSTRPPPRRPPTQARGAREQPERLLRGADPGREQLLVEVEERDEPDRRRGPRRPVQHRLGARRGPGRRGRARCARRPRRRRRAGRGPARSSRSSRRPGRTVRNVGRGSAGRPAAGSPRSAGTRRSRSVCDDRAAQLSQRASSPHVRHASRRARPLRLSDAHHAPAPVEGRGAARPRAPPSAARSRAARRAGRRPRDRPARRAVDGSGPTGAAAPASCSASSVGTGLTSARRAPARAARSTATSRACHVGARSSWSASSPSSSTTTAARSGTGANTASARRPRRVRPRARSAHAAVRDGVGSVPRELDDLAARPARSRPAAGRAAPARARRRSSSPRSRDAAAATRSRRSAAGGQAIEQHGRTAEQRRNGPESVGRRRRPRRRARAPAPAPRRSAATRPAGRAQRPGPPPRRPPAERRRRRPAGPADDRAQRDEPVGVGLGLDVVRDHPAAHAPAVQRDAHDRADRDAGRQRRRGRGSRSVAVERGHVRAGPGRPAVRRRQARASAALRKLVGVVGALPREVGLGAAEVAVRRGALVDRAAQVEPLDDRRRAQVEVLLHELRQLHRVDLGRAERLDHDRDRVGDADRVRDLHLAALRDPGRDDVLRRRGAPRTPPSGRPSSGPCR